MGRALRGVEGKARPAVQIKQYDSERRRVKKTKRQLLQNIIVHEGKFSYKHKAPQTNFEKISSGKTVRASTARQLGRDQRGYGCRPTGRERRRKGITITTQLK